MQFRLVYRGPLQSQGAGTGGSRLENKHAIRTQFHSQLKELWNQHSVLRGFTNEYTDPQRGRVSYFDAAAKDFTKFGYRFLPLINKKEGIACSLDVLFLRRDNPGNLVRSGGDIDNRIKVLFDGLRVPEYAVEVEGFPPQEGQDPFFCLLEDDDLITDVTITTDRLLIPLADDEHIHDVHLVLHVKTKVVDDRIGRSMWRS